MLSFLYVLEPFFTSNNISNKEEHKNGLKFWKISKSKMAPLGGFRIRVSFLCIPYLVEAVEILKLKSKTLTAEMFPIS